MYNHVQIEIIQHKLFKETEHVGYKRGVSIYFTKQ